MSIFTYLSLFLTLPLWLSAQDISPDAPCVPCGDKIQCGDGINSYIRPEGFKEIILVKDYCLRQIDRSNARHRKLLEFYEANKGSLSFKEVIEAKDSDIQTALPDTEIKAISEVQKTQKIKEEYSIEVESIIKNKEQRKPSQIDSSTPTRNGSWVSPSNEGMVRPNQPNSTSETSPSIKKQSSTMPPNYLTECQKQNRWTIEQCNNKWQEDRIVIKEKLVERDEANIKRNEQKVKGSESEKLNNDNTAPSPSAQSIRPSFQPSNIPNIHQRNNLNNTKPAPDTNSKKTKTTFTPTVASSVSSSKRSPASSSSPPATRTSGRAKTMGPPKDLKTTFFTPFGDVQVVPNRYEKREPKAMLNFNNEDPNNKDQIICKSLGDWDGHAYNILVNKKVNPDKVLDEFYTKDRFCTKEATKPMQSPVETNNRFKNFDKKENHLSSSNIEPKQSQALPGKCQNYALNDLMSQCRKFFPDLIDKPDNNVILLTCRSRLQKLANNKNTKDIISYSLLKGLKDQFNCAGKEKEELSACQNNIKRLGIKSVKDCKEFYHYTSQLGNSSYKAPNEIKGKYWYQFSEYLQGIYGDFLITDFELPPLKDHHTCNEKLEKEMNKKIKKLEKNSIKATKKISKSDFYKEFYSKDCKNEERCIGLTPEMNLYLRGEKVKGKSKLREDMQKHFVDIADTYRRLDQFFELEIDFCSDNNKEEIEDTSSGSK